jgi:hypothetical protein
VRYNIYRWFRRPNQEEAFSSLSYPSKLFFLVAFSVVPRFKRIIMVGKGRPVGMVHGSLGSYLSLLYSVGVLRQLNGVQIHSYRVQKKVRWHGLACIFSQSIAAMDTEATEDDELTHWLNDDLIDHIRDYCSRK